MDTNEIPLLITSICIINVEALLETLVMMSQQHMFRALKVNRLANNSLYDVVPLQSNQNVESRCTPDIENTIQILLI